MKADVRPPRAEKRPHSVTRHGRTITDDYAWLRAENWRDVMRDPSALAPDIRAYLEAANAYTDAMTADAAELRDRLYAEMRARIKEDDMSVPQPDGAYAYGVRYVTGGQHPLFIREARGGGGETVMLDGNALAEGRDYFRFGGATHAPDHRLLAWSYDDKGSEYYTLRFRDIASGDDLEDVVPDTGGGGVWSADARHVFYVRQDENHRPSRVFRHEIGTGPDEDVLVYEEPDPGFFVGVGKTQSERFIVIDCHDHETSEAYLLPSDDPSAEPRLVARRDKGVEYEIDEAGGTLYVLTNADGAKDFKIVTTPVEAPGRENWTDLVPHAPGRLLLDHGVLKRHLVRLERENGLPRIVIRRVKDGEEHEIAFDEEAYSLGLSTGYEFDTDTIRFTYSSMTTPSRVYEYDMETRERVLRKEQEVPSGHDPADYVTRRILAPSHDGELVPVSILHHKDTAVDGSAPCLLYGYGSYGMAMPAGFSTDRLSLVDRGWVYAIAHVRGGKEKGFSWYEDGKREKKTNTFRDFIAAGEHLVAEGYTATGRIVAMGGSAGGMLMGAVANMAPQLWGGIVALVPFVDVLNTMLDDTLPLTPPEWPEWGNPIESAADFETILAYSPYDNVEALPYPPILAWGGLTDPRVTYWEPAKWVAKLCEHAPEHRMILLKTNMDAGHGGASGRFERLKETAFAYAFAMQAAGQADA